MSIELVIDNRERKLIAELTDNIEFTTEDLSIGDILFREGGETVLIIERKTVQDLKASITDGRAREQKARLLGSGTQAERIMYLIEGNLDESLSHKVQGLPISTLIGSIINTQFRDNIKVYKTQSLSETANFVRKLLDKFRKDGENYFKTGEQSISSSKYAETLKKKKKANMTPEVWFISQLALIPQVTEKVAEQIVKVYPRNCDLVKAYNDTPEHLRCKLLSDIKITVANDKQRRIGDKMSIRIYNYLFGIDMEVEK